MSFTQFIGLTSALFSFPYFPLAIFAWKARPASSEEQGTPPPNYVWYLVLEVAVVVCVCLANFYLAEVAPFNGLITDDFIGRSVAGLEKVWDMARYSVCLLGVVLGGFLICRGLQTRSTNQNLARSLFLLSALTLAYAIAAPSMMENLVGSIRDSHLMK